MLATKAGGEAAFGARGARCRPPRRLPRPPIAAPSARAKKWVATGREDVGLSAAGILYGHGHLDHAQYSVAGWVTRLLLQVARSFGPGDSPAGVWMAILGALTKTPPGTEPGARRHLAAALVGVDTG